MPAPLALPPEERVAYDAKKNRDRVARFREDKPATIVYLSDEKRDLLKDLKKQTGCFTITEFMNDAFDFYAAHLKSVLVGVTQPTVPTPDGTTPTAEFPTEEPVAEAPEIARIPKPLEIPTEAQIEPPPFDASEIVTPPEPQSLQIVTPTPEPTPTPKVKARRRKAAKPPPKKPRNMWQQRWVDRAEADAANRVPVRLEFTWPHHHIPHGMRSMMMNNGLKHRKNIWRGRLTPERAATMVEEIAKYGGTLEITGGLGDEPKWTREEWGGGRQAKDKAA